MDDFQQIFYFQELGNESMMGKSMRKLADNLECVARLYRDIMANI
jgi:hypothetical protein